MFSEDERNGPIRIGGQIIRNSQRVLLFSFNSRHFFKYYGSFIFGSSFAGIKYFFFKKLNCKSGLIFDLYALLGARKIRKDLSSSQFFSFSVDFLSWRNQRKSVALVVASSPSSFHLPALQSTGRGYQVPIYHLYIVPSWFRFDFLNSVLIFFSKVLRSQCYRSWRKISAVVSPKIQRL